MAGGRPRGAPTAGDPLQALRTTLELLATASLPGLPPLSSGLVGFFAYDLVRRLERLPELAVDDLQLPDMVMLLATDIAAVDHPEGTVTLIANAVNWNATDERVDEAYDDAVARLDVMTEALEPATAVDGGDVRQARAQPPRPAHRRGIQRAVDKPVADIEAGEAFQVVPSQRFEMDTDVDPIDVYRMLRVSNPSPYMYLLNVPDALAERLFSGRLLARGARHRRGRPGGDPPDRGHPVAGRDTGGGPAAREELLSDDKERAEHLMLVDLGRNDLGRVCVPGTVRVEDYSHIERYSHVMHLVSTVTGLLTETTARWMR